MADVSKAVSDRLAIARTLTSAIDVHGAEVIVGLEAALFPDGAPQNVNLQVFFAALRAYVQRSTDDLSGKDQAHAVEMADDAGPREARDTAKAAVREGIIGTRATLEGVYGSTILAAYGLVGSTPDDADELMQMASTTETLLRERTIVEKPLRVGVSVNAMVIADDLKDRIQALRNALGAVRREEREAQVTRQARNEALEGWDKCYRSTADVVTGLFEMANKSEWADRVRPTARRRAGSPEPADSETSGETG